MGAVEGGSLEVLPAAVQAVGEQILSAAEQIRSGLASVDREIDAVLDTAWKGPTATRFSEGWTQAHDAGLDILNDLATLAAGLKVANRSYEDTDTAGAVRVSSLDL